MRTLKVNQLNIQGDYPDLEEISAKLDELGEGHSIDNIPWRKFSYAPDIKFNIAYGNMEIYLKYYVKENYILAEKSRTNEMVCEDSCVEFFISPENDGVYYNFEFNCIGTCLVKKGISRAGGQFIDPVVVQKIRRESSLGSTPFIEKKGDFFWEITIAIPMTSFIDHDIQDLKGKRMRANFYKCGDKLTEMHFLVWNKINTKEPDFHRPECFGEIEFI